MTTTLDYGQGQIFSSATIGHNDSYVNILAQISIDSSTFGIIYYYYNAFDASDPNNYKVFVNRFSYVDSTHTTNMGYEELYAAAHPRAVLDLGGGTIILFDRDTGYTPIRVYAIIINITSSGRTVGTPFQMPSTSGGVVDPDFYTSRRLAFVSPSLVVAIYYDTVSPATELYAVIFEYSGLTFSAISTQSLKSEVVSGEHFSWALAQQIDTSTFIINWREGYSSLSQYFSACSISGSTIIVGATYSKLLPDNPVIESILINSSSSVTVIGGNASSATGIAFDITVTGLVLGIGVLVSAVTDSGTYTNYPAGGIWYFTDASKTNVVHSGLDASSSNFTESVFSFSGSADSLVLEDIATPFPAFSSPRISETPVLTDNILSTAYYDAGYVGRPVIVSGVFSPMQSQMLLSISSPLIGGDYVWNTALIDGELYLQRRTAINGAFASQFDFGAATESELNAGTYRISVAVYDDDHVFVFGRFNHPTLGLTHIAYTRDGGATWEQPTGANWATDICAGLRLDANGTGYAIRTTTDNAPKLYAGTLSMQYISTLNMPSGTIIYQKNTVMGFDGVMYVAGVSPAGRVVVNRSNRSKSNWTDITGSLNMSSINSLASLE